ncbi:hypothetical protein J9303_15265 [Bacillaceae bacterium Marseille-Q3522]|nr:hypothetical protein [Bacillaceae bacterium Marseille-Q3522]
MQDSAEHIFERLVFSDENDDIFQDDEYKEQHRDYFIKEIREEIAYAKRTFKKIKHKYYIDNRSVDQVANDLAVMIQNISVNK